VTAEGGGPVAGASVTTDEGQSTTTNVDGDYSFDALVSGDCSVTVTAEGYAGQTRSGIVVAGGATAMDFVLSATSGTLLGRVADAIDGASLPGATVTLGSTSVATDAEGRYRISLVAPGGASVVIAKAGYVPQTFNATVVAGQGTVTDVSLSRVNLALGKQFFASRTFTTTYRASYAGDGNETTFWWPGPASLVVDSLTVNLGSVQAASAAQVLWSGTRYATEYSVYASTDGSNWTLVYSTSSGGPGTATVVFAARPVRYLRLDCAKAFRSNSGCGVVEFRVFE
jgi:hypothetical protein